MEFELDGIGDEEDFGFGVDDSSIAQQHQQHPHSAAGGIGGDPAAAGSASFDAAEAGDVFPAVDDGMIPADSDLLFDEIGFEPVNVSPLAALAALPADKLPKSDVRVGSGDGSIRNALSSVLAVRQNMRFRRRAEPAIPQVPQAAPTGQAAAPAAATGGDAGINAAEAAPTDAAGAGAPGVASPTGTGQPQLGDAASPTSRSGAAFPLIGPNGGGWRQKRIRSVVWSSTDTDTFFEGLRQFGTNLSLIARLFPGRDRPDIVRKFHHEMRTARSRCDNALDPINERPIDVEGFESRSHEWARTNLLAKAGPLAEEDADIMRELEASGHERPPQPPAEGTGRPAAAAAAAAAGEGQAGGAPAPAAAQDAQANDVLGDADRFDSGFTIFGDEATDDTPFVHLPEFAAAAAANNSAGDSDAQLGKGRKKEPASGRSKKKDASSRAAPTTAPAAPGAALTAEEAAAMTNTLLDGAAGDGFDFDAGDAGVDDEFAL